MVWCTHCGTDQPTERDDINGFICCTGCGRVHDDNIFSSDPTFVKTSGGQSQLSGNFVREGQYCAYGRVGGELSHEYGFRTDSHLKTLEKGKDEIEIIAESLCIGGRENMVNSGHRLYIIAVERNFTRGRRTNQVAAACLYIVCRQENKPFLLIDFSDVLQVNVYVLGAVFLQLCKLLRLEQHPMIQKPVDPSLFIDRFTDRLLGRTPARKHFHSITHTALRILASMKRDWMQTGRKPSGVCGAALYISALSHGFGCTKADIVNVVHICEATLTKRLIEFENTESGSLTTEEFEAKAKELEAEMQSIKAPAINPEIKGIKGIRELLCEHKGTDAKHFAHGLCQKCYSEFVNLSGGIQGGSAPPAFQRAEEQRRTESLQIKQDKEFFDNDEDEGSPCQIKAQESLEGDVQKTREKVKLTNEKKVEDGEPCTHDGDNAKGSRYKNTDSTVHTKSQSQDSQNGATESCISEAAIGYPEKTDDWSQLQCQDSYKVDDMDEKLETLSDIDDEEVERYLHNEEEVRLKTIIWTEMNKEYLEEQAAKEEAIAAAEAAHAAALAAAAEGAPDAVELAAAAAAAVARLKKDKQRKRAEEAKNKVPPQSAAEATRQMLEKKKLSSKVNYDVLEKLFEDNKKNGIQMSEEGKNTQNQSPVENGKRIRSIAWADEDSADFKHSKRPLQGELNEGNGIDFKEESIKFKEEGIEFKEEATDPNMEDELEGDDFDIADQDGVDNEHFQPYKLQYEHEDEYEYDCEEY